MDVLPFRNCRALLATGMNRRLVRSLVEVSGAATRVGAGGGAVAGVRRLVASTARQACV